MRIIGVDPGTRITGYGILEKNRGDLRHIDNGCIVTDTKATLSKKLECIFKNLQQLILQFQPSIVALEKVFYGKNVASTVKLGECRGVIQLVASLASLPVSEHTPAEVKKATTGYGHASKEQIQKMMQKILNLKEVPQEDATDALAIAYCSLQITEFRQKTGELVLK